MLRCSLDLRLTGPLMRALAENRPTPWLGALERVNAYTMHTWTVVLAGVLIRRSLDADDQRLRRL